MQMSDVRWPSLREAARRFLKTESCVLWVDKINIQSATYLVQSIADHIPARLQFPQIEIGILGVENLFQIGGDKPNAETCWVPNCGWADFEEQVLELLEAGYPGCVGCAGPGAETEWDEHSRRRLFLA
jgi:hypothetical protein